MFCYHDPLKVYLSRFQKWAHFTLECLRISLHLFQKFRTEETTSVLTKQKAGHPADSGKKLPVKVDGKKWNSLSLSANHWTSAFSWNLAAKVQLNFFKMAGWQRPTLLFFLGLWCWEMHMKKITLMNSSFVTNHWKFLMVSSQLQDLLSIK